MRNVNKLILFILFSIVDGFILTMRNVNEVASKSEEWFLLSFILTMRNVNKTEIITGANSFSVLY